MRLPLFVIAAATSLSFPVQAGGDFRDCAGCPEMIAVPAGSFVMGAPPDEPGRDDSEGPQHRVAVTHGFAIGKFDVTRAQYALFVADTKRNFTDPKCDWANPKSRGERFAQRPDEPVVCVSWNDATAYAAWLARKTHRPYRLPSEIEWEYAARAGSTTARPWGAGLNHDNANYGTDTCCAPAVQGRDRWRFTSPVGSFPANRFGLFDPLGNVWQWTADCAHDYGGTVPDDCSKRMSRGGAWFQAPDSVRSAARAADDPDFRIGDIGFRVALDLAGQPAR